MHSFEYLHLNNMYIFIWSSSNWDQLNPHRHRIIFDCRGPRHCISIGWGCCAYTHGFCFNLDFVNMKSPLVNFLSFRMPIIPCLKIRFGDFFVGHSKMTLVQISKLHTDLLSPPRWYSSQTFHHEQTLSFCIGRGTSLQISFWWRNVSHSSCWNVDETRFTSDQAGQ